MNGLRLYAPPESPALEPAAGEPIVPELHVIIEPGADPARIEELCRRFHAKLAAGLRDGSPGGPGGLVAVPEAEGWPESPSEALRTLTRRSRPPAGCFGGAVILAILATAAFYGLAVAAAAGARQVGWL
jgi:hypothetical protein